MADLGGGQRRFDAYIVVFLRLELREMEYESAFNLPGVP
jgi:hypothetical protein